MNFSEKTVDVTYVQFAPLTGEQIQRCGIRLTKNFSHNTASTENTPADERLGDNTKCKSCSRKYNDCPGHFGYIDLAMPVLNPCYIKYTIDLLKCFCLECSHLVSSEIEYTVKGDGISRLLAFRERCERAKTCGNCGVSRDKFMCKNQNVIYEGKELHATKILDCFKKISNSDLNKIGMNNHLFQTAVEISKTFLPENYIHPLQVRPEAFIFTSLIVIPIQSRPHIIQNGDRKEDKLTDQYNLIIKTNNALALMLGRYDILDPSFIENLNTKKRGNGGARSKKDSSTIYESLKLQIYSLINSNKVKGEKGKGGIERKINGIHERLTGKHGHIQSNAAGKRSDQSARDVIVSGGPFLKMYQIGVPEYIAKTLSFPEKVTPWNIEHLSRKLYKWSYSCKACEDIYKYLKDMYVLNDELIDAQLVIETNPDEKSKLEREQNNLYKRFREECKGLLLKTFDEETSQRHHSKFPLDEQQQHKNISASIVGPGSIVTIRRPPFRGIQDVKRLTQNFTKPLEIDGHIGLKVGDLIERHLQDGDWGMFCRQPTISIESMQGVQLVINRTGIRAFQLPLPVTHPYNADFGNLCKTRL